MFSVPKILLLVVIVGAVFAASRLLRGRRGNKPPVKTDNGAAPDALDLDKCPSCGRYVADGSAACERADCPKAG